MASKIGDIIAHLKLDISQFTQAAKQATSEVADMTSSMENVDTSAADSLTESIEGAGEAAGDTTSKLDKLSKTGKKMSKVGKSMTKKVTAPIMAAATASVKLAADFEQSMQNVSAISGATGEDLDKLKGLAMDLGASTKFSAKEAADAMGYMAMAGWKTEDMMSGLKGVMDLAAASGEDLATTSDIVTDALTAFGLSASDSGKFADVLAAASANANTNVYMLGESFKYAAPIAGSLGMTVEDTSIALGLMANAGIKGSQGGTALRASLTRLVKPTKESSKWLDKLNIDVTNTDGSMKSLKDVMDILRDKMGNLTEAEQAQAAATIFGQEAMSGMLAIINASDSDYEKLTNAIYNSEGAAAEMAETMQDTFQGALEELGGALETLGIQVGNILIPFLKVATKAVTGLVEFLNKVPGPIKAIVIAFGLLVAAIGPVVWILGSFLGSITNIINGWKLLSGLLGGGGTIFTGITTAITAVKAAFSSVVSVIVGPVLGALKALFAALLANPITLIIAAIAALVAAFIYAWNNIDGFKEFWVNLWEKVKEAFLNAINWIIENFSKWAESVGKFFTEVIPQAGEKLLAWLAELPGKIFYWLVYCVSYVALWHQQMIEKLIAWGQEFIPKVVEFISQMPGKIWEWLVKTVEKFTEWRRQVIQKVVELGTEFLQKTGEWLSQLPGKIWQWLSTTIQKFIEWRRQVVEKAKEAGKQFLDNFINFIKQLPGKIWEWLTSTLNKIKEWGRQAIQAAKDAGQKIVTNVTNAVKQLPGKMLQLGKDIIGGIVKGIGSAAGSLFSKMKSIATSAVDAAKKSLGIKSPSRVFASVVGEQIPAGIEQGILAGEKSLLATMNRMSDDLVVGASVDTTKLGTMNIQPTKSTTQDSTMLAQLLNELYKLNDKRTEYNINIERMEADNPQDIRKLAEELETFKRYKRAF